MQQQNETPSSKLVTTEKALTHAVRVRDLAHEMADRRAALQKELEDRLIEIQTAILSEMQAEWNQLCDEMKISPDERECWWLDSQYYEAHQLMFVVQDQERARAHALVQSRILGTGAKHS